MPRRNWSRCIWSQVLCLRRYSEKPVESLLLRGEDLLREYLTEAEIDKLVAAAGESRNPIRDRLMIRMAFLHALRVSELVDLRWQQVHLETHTIDIRRAKNGTPGIHGLAGDEIIRRMV